MKKWFLIFACLFFILEFVFRLHAQDGETVTLLQALEATTPLPADAVPQFGNFYSAQHAPDSAEAWPPLPCNIRGLDVWLLGDGMFLMDDRAVDYSTLSGGGGMQLMSMDPNDPSDGDTNSYNPNFVPSFTPTTNDLWLQIILKTNTTAYVVIHPPWNVTNGVYDLLYTTNLALPVSWQWVLRTDPGQTNLIVSNAVDAQGFYWLGAPNDLVANDSLGTNFWFAQMFIASTYSSRFSIYISSPVGASGTVDMPGVFTNGATMIASNCGYANLNGTYVRTNLTAQEQGDWFAAGLDPANDSYVQGTNWVNYRPGYWYMFIYDPATRQFSFFYQKYGINLNSSDYDWEPYDLYDPTLPPTTFCTQYPLPLSKSFTVAAGGMTNILLTNAVMILQDHVDVVEAMGIHLTANASVSVYELVYTAQGTTAFTCYPVPLLGTSYCLMSRPSFVYDSFHPGQSELAIVATASNTTVNITPSTNANLGGHLWTNPIVLQRGQTYQTKSTGYTDDVSGTRVTADKPIAVFAGDVIAFVPDDSALAGNPIVQEQLPVNSWGSQAFSMGFAGRTGGDIYRVLAAYNNTVVWTNGVVAGTNQAGGFLDLTNAGPLQFQATHPIQVAHFANGYQFDHNETGEGDPCEILLPPTGHYLQTNIVVTLPNDSVTGDFHTNYLNLIVPQAATTTTILDRITVGVTNFVAIGTSGYYGTQLVVTNGVHKVTSSQPIGVEVYGFGYQDAYGYFGGVVK